MISMPRDIGEREVLAVVVPSNEVLSEADLMLEVPMVNHFSKGMRRSEPRDKNYGDVDVRPLRSIWRPKVRIWQLRSGPTRPSWVFVRQQWSSRHVSCSVRNYLNSLVPP